jgi:coenzyme F420-reducing hydrogenase gamma subunit|tara:strand:+ start:205 stop:753 length:549 start_codon:yes stop_codon:yes gene_type:complete
MISRSFIAALSAKFNILDVIDLPEVDSNFAILADRLLNTKKKYFATKDRYVIGHLDTDYYLPGCPYGLGMFNLVRTFLHNDVPLNTLILLTNHPGIKKEFEILIPIAMQEHNFPTVVDDCITIANMVRLGLDQDECSIDESSIVNHGISMMGAPRPHRNMLYNQLVEKNLLDAYAVSYKGNT